MPQKAVKEKALNDFLVDYPIPDTWELNDNLLREEVLFIDVLSPWKMYLN